MSPHHPTNPTSSSSSPTSYSSTRWWEQYTIFVYAAPTAATTPVRPSTESRMIDSLIIARWNIERRRMWPHPIETLTGPNKPTMEKWPTGRPSTNRNARFALKISTRMMWLHDWTAGTSFMSNVSSIGWKGNSTVLSAGRYCNEPSCCS